MTTDELWHRIPVELTALADAWTAAGRQPPPGLGVFKRRTLAEVQEVLRTMSSFADLLEFDDTNPGVGVWVALALARLGLRYPSPVPTEIDEPAFLAGAVASDARLDVRQRGCCIIAGDLMVAELRVSEESALVVAGDLTARTVCVSGVVIVTGSVDSTLLQVLGNDGTFWVDGACRAAVLDDPHGFDLCAAVETRCDVRALRAAGGLESTLQTLAVPLELHARLYR